jgi:hypothetical protein
MAETSWEEKEIDKACCVMWYLLGATRDRLFGPTDSRHDFAPGVALAFLLCLEGILLLWR